jgi:lipopolysaccharide assembly outer membrane protein LptD (OstA)
MGLKLEFLLVFVIAVTSIVTMTTKLTQQNRMSEIFTKELEFTNTTFREVTTEKREGVAFGTHGTRDAGILTIDNLRYHNDNIKLLLADRGTYKGKELYLDGNVTVHRKAGHDYHTDHAVYNQKSEILYVTSPFVAYIDRNIIHGKTLEYHMRTKEAYATSVNATVYTLKK